MPHALKPSKPPIMPVGDPRQFIRKEMNKYLEDEKEAGTYEAVGIFVEERSIRKSYQAVAKRAHPFSSTGGSS